MRHTLTIVMLALLAIALGGCHKKEVKRPDTYNYNRAVELAENDEPDEAVKYFKEEIDEHPDNVVEIDTNSVDDGMDWTPTQFREECHDEWVVVRNAINIQQNNYDDIDYAAIGRLVNAYIRKKGIVLPSDAEKRIEEIDSICKKCFDIEEYGKGNFDRRIAWGTRRLFDEYVLWLYEQKGRKVLLRNPVIDLDRERKLIDLLKDAMLHVCDSVACRMEGSYDYISYANVQYIKLNFEKNTYKSLLGSKIEAGRQLDVPMDVFDKECDLLIANYKQLEERQPEDATSIIRRFQKAFHQWYAYRKTVSSQLKAGKFKKDYDAITYSYARTYLLHLKNRFEDIGLMTNWISEIVLPDDCSNKELLEYSYEESYKRHLK